MFFTNSKNTQEIKELRRRLSSLTTQLNTIMRLLKYKEDGSFNGFEYISEPTIEFPDGTIRRTSCKLEYPMEEIKPKDKKK